MSADPDHDKAQITVSCPEGDIIYRHMGSGHGFFELEWQSNPRPLDLIGPERKEQF